MKKEQTYSNCCGDILLKIFLGEIYPQQLEKTDYYLICGECQAVHEEDMD